MKRTYIIPQVTLNNIELQSAIMVVSMVGGGLMMGGNTNDLEAIPYGN